MLFGVAEVLICCFCRCLPYPLYECKAALGFPLVYLQGDEMADDRGEGEATSCLVMHLIHFWAGSGLVWVFLSVGGFRFSLLSG